MIPALFTSSSALDASQTMLSVVGNNLANSNTTGYKSQTLLFSNQFSQLLSDASQPTPTNGGSNPVQIGMGVQVAATDTNLTEGTFQSTGNPLNMAIQNGGYFVLQDGAQTVYTRAGAFTVDADGTMVDPSTGAKVQRTGTVGEGTATSPAFQVAGNNDISIPTGLTIPGSPTQNISFSGNLSANATGPQAQVLTTGQGLKTTAGPATTDTLLNDLVQTTGSGYTGGETIDITGTRVDGTTVNDIYNVQTGSDTLGMLLNQINLDFLSGSSTGATASINSSGQIVLTANTPGASNATLNLVNGTPVVSTTNPTPSETTTSFSNFVQTVVGKAGDKATTTDQVFDAQGTAHNVTFTFQKQGSNSWNVTASMNATDGTITGFGNDNTVSGITFNQDGSLESVAGTSTPQTLITKDPLLQVSADPTEAPQPADASTTLDSLVQSVPYGPNDSITITGTDSTGKAFTPVVVDIFDSTGAPLTVQDLLNSINEKLGPNVATIDKSGNIVITAPQSGQSAITLNIADTPTNSGVSNFSSFVQTSPGTNGDSNLTFQIANLSGFGTPQTVSLNLGTPNGFSGVTQTGSDTSVNVSGQDGYAQGTLESTSISSNGVITGLFTNGKSESLAQIALATFSNPGGLQNAGNNYLTYTTASGLPIIAAPGTGGAGTIQSGGLEGSNVDVGTEFTQLIAAQRGYEVNAKAFSIANTMMQDSIDLIR